MTAGKWLSLSGELLETGKSNRVSIQRTLAGILSPDPPALERTKGSLPSPPSQPPPPSVTMVARISAAAAQYSPSAAEDQVGVSIGPVGMGSPPMTKTSMDLAGWRAVPELRKDYDARPLRGSRRGPVGALPGTFGKEPDWAPSLRDERPQCASGQRPAHRTSDVSSPQRALRTTTMSLPAQAMKSDPSSRGFSWMMPDASLSSPGEGCTSRQAELSPERSPPGRSHTEALQRRRYQTQRLTSTIAVAGVRMDTLRRGRGLQAAAAEPPLEDSPLSLLCLELDQQQPVNFPSPSKNEGPTARPLLPLALQSSEEEALAAESPQDVSPALRDKSPFKLPLAQLTAQAPERVPTEDPATADEKLEEMSLTLEPAEGVACPEAVEDSGTDLAQGTDGEVPLSGSSSMLEPIVSSASTAASCSAGDAPVPSEMLLSASPSQTIAEEEDEPPGPLTLHPRRSILISDPALCSRSSNKGSATVRRSRSMPADKRDDEAQPGGLSSKAPMALLLSRRGRGSMPMSALPKSTAAAAAGAGSVAARVRKKGSSRKMVLPFSYAADDPRFFHVESTEGRIIPEFLPEFRLAEDDDD